MGCNMKEFVEKLNEKLYENVKSNSCPSDSCLEHSNKDCDKCNFKKIMISDVIEIVNHLVEEYNNCLTNISTDKSTTNADRIRNMSDEELAELLTKITDDAQLDARTKCNYQWGEWLQSEAE